MTQQREFPMLIPVKLETNLIANRPYLTVLKQKKKIKVYKKKEK
jgi:hypothetical protein